MKYQKINHDIRPKTIDIESRSVGPGFPVFITAEIAQAHDVSLGTAHAFIDAVAESGADGVKLQTHIAAEESTPEEPWRFRFSPQDETRYAYRRAGPVRPGYR